jgi:hypothetical protein
MSAADTPSPTRVAYRPSWVQRRANTVLTRALRKGRGPSFMCLLASGGLPRAFLLSAFARYYDEAR